MHLRRLLFAQLCVLVVLYLAERVAISFYNHSPNEFFFFPIHVLGGIWVGLLTSWALLLEGYRIRILLCVLVALLFGTGWEIWEFMTGLTHFPADTLDTFNDLCADMIGGALAYILAKYLVRT